MVGKRDRAVGAVHLGEAYLTVTIDENVRQAVGVPLPPGAPDRWRGVKLGAVGVHAFSVGQRRVYGAQRGETLRALSAGDALTQDFVHGASMGSDGCCSMTCGHRALRDFTAPCDQPLRTTAVTLHGRLRNSTSALGRAPSSSRPSALSAATRLTRPVTASAGTTSSQATASSAVMERKSPAPTTDESWGLSPRALPRTSGPARSERLRVSITLDGHTRLLDFRRWSGHCRCAYREIAAWATAPSETICPEVPMPAFKPLAIVRLRAFPSPSASPARAVSRHLRANASATGGVAGGKATVTVIVSLEPGRVAGGIPDKSWPAPCGTMRDEHRYVPPRCSIHSHWNHPLPRRACARLEVLRGMASNDAALPGRPPACLIGYGVGRRAARRSGDRA